MSSWIETVEQNGYDDFMWCNECDQVQVASEEDGKMLKVFGHRYDINEGFGRFEPVYFTLCHECLKNFKFEEVTTDG